MALDLDRLLEGLDLVDLARQAGAKLHKAGRSHRSACPLHANADNPTGFSIHPARSDPNRQLWTCHRCGTGNALQFIEKWRCLDFMGAVEFAAGQLRLSLADLGLTPAAAQEHAQREKRRDVLDLAAAFYERRFRHHRPAVCYAAITRGFKHRALMTFGYSDGKGLREHLEAHGADLALAREVGVLRKDGRDFTSNQDGDAASPDGWLVYIHRNGARVDYLSARALAPVNPKDKSRNLPGPKHVFRCEVADDLSVVLVEGQADAKSLQQLGVSAWALCGASLSEADVRALSRRKAVYLALDDDTHQAGTDEEQADREETQTGRRAQLSELLGPLTMICPPLPPGIKDANAWLQHSPDLTERKVRDWLQGKKRARPYVELFIAQAAGLDPVEQAEAISAAAHLLARLPQELQPKYYRLAAKAFDMKPQELQRANGHNAAGEQTSAAVLNGHLALYGQKLMTALALITKQQTVIDGTTQPLLRYTITGRLADGQPLRELQVPASDFEGMAWLTEWGVKVMKLCPPGDKWKIALAIQQLSIAKENGMKEETVYAHTGWAVIDGQRSFLTGAGRLTAAGLDTGTQIDLGENNMRHALPAPPEGEALRLAVRASLDFLAIGPRHVTAPLWAAMFAAPLMPLRSLDCVMWVYGSSGSGKSTTSHIALAHFGSSFASTRNFRPQIGWNATAFAIEMAMFVCKDVPLIIDDYAPQMMSGRDRERLRHTANETIRGLGNRMSRGRGGWSKTGGTTKARQDARGLVLSTAENPIQGQSLVNRLLYVPIEKGDVLRPEGNAVLDRAQQRAAGGLYAQAMSAYICWLIAHWDELAAEFPAMVDEAAAEARAVLPTGFDRLPDYYAVLHVAQKLALRAFVDMGVITASLAEGEAEDNSQALLKVVTGQVGRVGEEAPAKMFLQAIQSMLRNRKVYLAPRKRLNNPTPPPDRADLVGWYDHTDKGAIWLTAQEALMAAKQWWKADDIVFDTTRDALGRLLKQADVLRATDLKAGKNEVSVWLYDHNDRVLEIDLQKVLDLWGFDLRYPRELYYVQPPDDDDDAPPITQAGLDLL